MRTIIVTAALVALTIAIGVPQFIAPSVIESPAIMSSLENQINSSSSGSRPAISHTEKREPAYDPGKAKKALSMMLVFSMMGASVEK